MHAVALFQAMYRRDIGMIQRRQYFRFPLEAGEALWIARKDLREDLDRHIPIEPRIAGAIHLPHAADADAGDDFVRPEASAGREGHRLFVKLAGL